MKEQCEYHGIEELELGTSLGQRLGGESEIGMFQ